jgi:cytochrome c553
LRTKRFIWGAAALLAISGCGDDDTTPADTPDAAVDDVDSGQGDDDVTPDDDADDDITTDDDVLPDDDADDDITPDDDAGADDDVGIDAGPDDDVTDGGTEDVDASTDDSGTAEPIEAGPGDAGEVGDIVARGEYIVTTLALCGDCHTGRNPDGSPALDRFLGGVECFIDVAPEDDAAGCLNTANLSNHETGLANRSDDEIKDMFLLGVRPNGEALHPFMPYFSLANMTDEDADAIVAFLRTVPGVENQIPPNQVPFTPPDAPVAPIDMALVPMPDENYPQFESAMRGRYLTSQVGSCLECHTPEDPAANPPRDMSLAFQGGAEFPAAAIGLPVPPFPDVIFSQNITPHEEFGIGTWTVDDVVTALREGHRPDQSPLCPPMPAGPEGALANLTDEDATDIANYLLSIPPGDNDPPQCQLSMPPSGDAGAGDAGAP